MAAISPASPSKPRSWWQRLGPGIITGAADDDPSGIITYTQTGAQLGYRSLWLAPFLIPLMFIAQERCARIGIVTGQGLAANIRKFAPRFLPVLALLFLIANIINIGADLGAMAAIIKILVGWPLLITSLALVSLILVLEVFLSYKVYAKYLKLLTLVLLVYLLTMVLVEHDWMEIWRGTVGPMINFNKESLLTIVAVFGTTISPYLFFWQASEEVEEEVAKGYLNLKQRRGATQQEIKTMRQDTFVGMTYSNIIMWAIIATAAGTLGLAGITTVATAQEAALTLRPLAGEYAFLLFAVGIIGIGLLAVPILAGSAAYALAETFRWREGLYLKFKQAPGFYSIIIAATVIGLLLNLLGFNPIRMLYYAAVINGVVSLPLLVMIVSLAKNKKVMGNFRTTSGQTFLGWLLVGCVALAVGLLLVSVLGLL